MHAKRLYATRASCQNTENSFIQKFRLDNSILKTSLGLDRSYIITVTPNCTICDFCAPLKIELDAKHTVIPSLTTQEGQNVTCECSFDSSTDCMNQTIKKDCFCSCLEAKLDAYYTTQLKVQANYLCTHFLKECKDIWTLSFSYTVVNTSTLNEELYTSERILVPHDQEIIREIKELEIAGKYSIKIKPSCTICGSGCKVIHLSSKYRHCSKYE
ncbi:unnamed protein product [Mytilus coruscus]|uniref:Uncharacterized protein n=1 Tax=Mytilus coruscus TaxID=42192 RepID=A0A6J8DGE0_MYTCO|nr:unnamed protein product [Mytilus coruscus]